MELQLVKKEPLLSNIVTFYWSAPEPVIWRAGQYGVFFLPHQNMDTGGPERFFTISSPPSQLAPQQSSLSAAQPGTSLSTKRGNDNLSLTTRISNSSYKQALNNMQLGDSIQLQSVGGEFILDQNKAQYIFIAFGIGITPFRAILLDATFHHTPINAQLLFQHQPDEFIFQSDFQNIQHQLELPINHFDHTQPLVDHLLKNLPTYQSAKFYISGPVPVVEQLEELLTQNNISIDNIYCDYFEYDWSQLAA